MRDVQSPLTVKEIIASTTAQLTEKGYNNDYQRAIAGIYTVFAAYCDGKNETFYSASLGQHFLLDRYAARKLSKSRQKLVNRAMQMLADMREFGTITIRRRSNREFPAQFFDSCWAYLNELRRINRSEKTVKSQKHSLHNLAEFLDGIGVKAISNLTLDHMNEYIKSALCNYCRSSAATRLRDARRVSLHSFLTKEKSTMISRLK